MKKILLTAFLTVALVGAAQAQSGSGLDRATANILNVAPSDAASINVLTTIVNQVTIDGTQDLDFGFIGSGDGTFSQQQAGEFTITGEAGSTVALSSPTTNFDLSGNQTVTWTPTMTLGEVTLDGTPGGAAQGQETITITGDLTLNNAQPGDYGTTYELVAEYVHL